MRTLVNSLHDEVALGLREQIFSGALPPGSFLDEAALCERLSISRTPLREALKVLVAEGLLRHEPRRGCFVAEVTERDLDEIFPVIALLEGCAARGGHVPCGRCRRGGAGSASRAPAAMCGRGAHHRLLHGQPRNP